jgi:hypothetical protein
VTRSLKTTSDHFTINIRIHEVTKTWVADEYTRSGGGFTAEPVSDTSRSTDEVVTVTVRAKTKEDAIRKAVRYLEVEGDHSASAE